MTSLSATIRETKTKGEINSLRAKGFVPCIIYGGVEKNQKIYINKKIIKNLINSENFLSNKMSLEINGKEEKVLPREISFDPVTDEPLQAINKHRSRNKDGNNSFLLLAPRIRMLVCVSGMATSVLS